MSHRYAARPPHFDSDFAVTSDRVFLPICVTLAPVSLSIEALANETPMCRALDPSPMSTLAG